MDVCPNCGEPLEENAAVCPYCGSDDETGWRDDADYYSVEIPEDDFRYDDATAESSEHHWEDWPGWVLLASAVAAMICAGISAYAWGAAIPLLFLGLCALIYRLGTRHADESG